MEAEPNLTGTIQELGDFGYIVCRLFTIFVSLLVISITLCFSSTVGWLCKYEQSIPELFTIFVSLLVISITLVFLLQLVDFVSMNRASQNDEGWHRIAWAFLKVMGNNNKVNTGSKVRLQLFEAPQSNIKSKNQVEEEHFLWWKQATRKPYPSTLYVTLKGITPPREVEPAERSLFATQEEKGRMTYEDLKKSVNWTGKKWVCVKGLDHCTVQLLKVDFCLK